MNIHEFDELREVVKVSNELKDVERALNRSFCPIKINFKEAEGSDKFKEQKEKVIKLREHITEFRKEMEASFMPDCSTEYSQPQQA